MNIDWGALGLVLLISVVVGGALVSLVSLGITALDRRVIARENGESMTSPTVVMGVCFLCAVALIGYGLYLVVATG